MHQHILCGTLRIRMNLDLSIVLKIIYALGIGVLIGLERSLIPSSTAKCEPDTADKGMEPEPPDILIGIRTFSVLSLGGFSAAMIGTVYLPIAPVIVAGMIMFVIFSYLHTRNDDPGITTEIAAVVCCGLGVLCYSRPHEAGVLALLITILLALKRSMTRVLLRLKRVELTDTLKFLAIILIVLPILPNRALDPYAVFNPYKVMFLVILISGISFVGYFLTKFLGADRGLGLTGLFGGLTSSTAVTAAMANQARQTPGLMDQCTFATIIANATMFCRVLVVVAILDRALMMQLAWSIGTMTIGAAIAVAFLWLHSKNGHSKSPDGSKDLSLKNPFSLGPAIKFSLFFVCILFVAKIANIYLGDKGLYLASLVSGLADVDAITLSISEQTKITQLSHTVGAVGITIAVVANSIVKSGIALYSGGLKFGIRVGSILLGVTIAGLGVLLFF
jgi:uncharacterized membrane protein (DUF4010 family)